MVGRRQGRAEGLTQSLGSPEQARRLL